MEVKTYHIKLFGIPVISVVCKPEKDESTVTDFSSLRVPVAPPGMSPDDAFGKRVMDDTLVANFAPKDFTKANKSIWRLVKDKLNKLLKKK